MAAKKSALLTASLAVLAAMKLEKGDEVELCNDGWVDGQMGIKGDGYEGEVGDFFSVVRTSPTTGYVTINNNYGDISVPFFILRKTGNKVAPSIKVGDYNAKIDASQQEVVVDCQHIPFKKVEELYNTIKPLMKKPAVKKKAVTKKAARKR